MIVYNVHWEYGWEQSLPDLRDYPSIHVEGLKVARKSSSQDHRSLGWFNCFSNLVTLSECRIVGWLMNDELKRYERKWSCPNLMYYTGIFFWRGWRSPRTTSVRIVVVPFHIQTVDFPNKNHNHYSMSQLLWSLVLHSNLEPHSYQSLKMSTDLKISGKYCF